jgi:hypothetical protein
MKIRNSIHALGHALLVFIYSAGVAWLMFNAQTILGSNGKPDNFLAPLSMLMLFVFSATVVGALVLGKPIILYLNGHKTEALKFFGYTVLWLFLITLCAFILLIWI